MSKPGHHVATCTSCGTVRHLRYPPKSEFCNPCGVRASKPALFDRFMAFVDKRQDGCWHWVGHRTPKIRRSGGYGLFDGRVAHRMAYQLHVGPIPSGMQLDHLCRVQECVNPAHLEPVTAQENVRRHAATRTHCKNGHEFTPENTKFQSRRDRPGGSRRCIACLRARGRAK